MKKECLEIERKWLVNPNAIPWKSLNCNFSCETMKITQQYIELPTEEYLYETRIRRVESSDSTFYYKTIKSFSEDCGLARKEYEHEMLKEEFYGLFNEQNGNIIEKTRYIFSSDKVKYELDIYNNPKGLVVVEIEFASVEEANNYTKPYWFGEEVTEDSRYKNVNIAQYGLEDRNRIIEIVLTGGPCGGKSTITTELKMSFEEKGVKVLVSKEVATDVMESGALPWEVQPYIFQGAIVDSMISNEKRMRLLAEEYRQKGQDVIIFYDRGLSDNRAYCDDNTWNAVLAERELNTEAINSMYDAVYDIETTAYGAEEVFMKQMSNNPTRYENTIELARETEDKTKSAWSGHHNLLVFGNGSSGWIGKQNAIFNETYRVLGMLPVIKRDERYLVDLPINLEEFYIKNNCSKQEIEQIYLRKDNNVERRIRKIGDGTFFAYYYTEKEGHGKDRIVREEIIDKDMYKSLSVQADESRKPIKKTRYPFVQCQEYYVLDVFPEGEYNSLPVGKGIIESKGTTDPNKESVIPQGFKNVEDITNNVKYSNVMLALK